MDSTTRVRNAQGPTAAVPARVHAYIRHAPCVLHSTAAGLLQFHCCLPMSTLTAAARHKASAIARCHEDKTRRLLLAQPTNKRSNLTWCLPPCNLAGLYALWLRLAQRTRPREEDRSTKQKHEEIIQETTSRTSPALNKSKDDKKCHIVLGSPRVQLHPGLASTSVRTQGCRQPQRLKKKSGRWCVQPWTQIPYDLGPRKYP